MILHSRYEFIRDRLITLYDLVQHRTFRIWIAPEKLMSLDQLRSRPTYTQEGFANDTDFYTEKQMRLYRIPQILDLLGNIQTVHDFGFEKPSKTIVEIYEGLTEYIALWCELIKNTDFKSPTFQELRELENFTYLLFSEYKRIKPFVKREADRKTYAHDEQLEGKGLAGFRALFGSSSLLGKGGTDEISFYSHLDEINPQYGPAASAPLYNPTPFNPLTPTYALPAPVVPMDSLFTPEAAHASNPNWIFREG